MKILHVLTFGVGLILLTACAAPVNPPARTQAATSTPTPLIQATVTPRPAPTEMSTAAAAPTAAPTAPPTAPPPTPAATAQPIGPFEIDLKPIVQGGLVRPAYVTHAGDDRLFIVEQPGRIRLLRNGQLLAQPFLDIADKVTTDGNEQGLLSVAFHPAFQQNGQFFVNYTRRGDGATVIERYTLAVTDPDRADVRSGQVLLVIAQPEANHNGGLIKFGPDGYLYVGMGDGGGRGDQHGAIGNGQDPQSLLGKLLRLDVTNQATYAIPASNPFNTEIWASGVRNPWRFSFDRATGDLFIADVGQNAFEEVNFQPAASAGGENYGWRIMEASHCYNPPEGCNQAGLVPPIAEYSHNEGGCSVTGGYVYRGSQYPAMQGVYFFGDYCSGIIWSLQRNGDGWQMTKRLEAGVRISSFGEDVNGEVYVVDHSGAIYHLVAR
jgi:glucose/arabinose dehydrogenase